MIGTILILSILVTLIALGAMMFLGWPKSNGLAGLILAVVFACSFGSFQEKFSKIEYCNGVYKSAEDCK